MMLYPLDPASPPTEFRLAELLVAGGSMPDGTLPLDFAKGTYLSIRRQDERFVGGILLMGSVNISSIQYPGEFAGSFDVAVPK